MDPMNLLEWSRANEPGETMLWKTAFWNQVMFIRDVVAPRLEHAFEMERQSCATVVSTHRSKSIVCPVYSLRTPAFHAWARYNFYDWNVSVQSAKPVVAEFGPLFDDETGYGYCYMQGMEDKKFPRFRESPSRFTVCIGDHHEMFAFVHLLTMSAKKAA